jgi:hypothetical protein
MSTHARQEVESVRRMKSEGLLDFILLYFLNTQLLGV